jgi:hypothetical protein
MTMNDWREKVEAALIEAGRAWERGDRSRSLTDMYAQAAIAELLPVMKAEMVKVARSKKYEPELIPHNVTCEEIAAAIEAWEPEA